MQPVTLEASKSLSSILWFTQGGLINIKVTLPCTGYSPNGAVPVEVFVDNGSGREIRHVVVSLHRPTTYRTPNSHYIRHRHCSIATAISNPVHPQTTATWEPPPLPVPPMISTLAVREQTIIEIYSIHVVASIPWARDVMIEIPVVIGNVQPTPILPE